MKIIIKEMKKELMERYGHYYKANDLAHQEDHFDTVFETAKHIRDVLNMDYDLHNDRILLLSAYLHDLFAVNRDVHHELSKHWVLNSGCPIIKKYTMLEVKDFRGLNELERVAYACGEHRSSYKGEFSSSLSELINSADREFPTTPEYQVERAILYLIGKGERNEKTILRGAISHVKEKYGTKGYARYPTMYQEAFGDLLEKSKIAVDNLDDKGTPEMMEYTSERIFWSGDLLG